MARGRVEKVRGHRIDQGEVPRCPACGRRLELGDAESRIRQPGHVADEVAPEITKRLEGPIVHRRPAPQGRVDDDLEGRRCFRHPVHLRPIDLYRCAIRITRGRRRLPARADRSCNQRHTGRRHHHDRHCDARAAHALASPFVTCTSSRLTEMRQQTRSTGMRRSAPSRSIRSARWPTPTAQWCAGPWLFQSFTNRRAPVAKR